MKQRVLVVDDERLIRELLRRSLTQRGLQVELAADGHTAIEVITKSPPDLVLLDLMMPKADGFDVMRAVADLPNIGAMQIIVLTARASQDVLQEALAAGADDYISKPFHLSEVISRVEAHLRIAQYARQLNQSRADSSALLEISHRLTSQLSVSTLLQDISECVAGLIDIAQCAVVLLDHRSNARVVAAADPRAIGHEALPMREYPALSRVIATGEAEVVEHAPVFPNEPMPEGPCSGGVHPLRDGNRVVGALVLRSTKTIDDFGDRERQIGHIVANSAAIAMANARQFDDIKEETREVNRARLFAEERLEAVEQYKDFFENAADGTFITTDDGRVVFVNERGEQLLNCPRGRLLGLNFSAVLDPASRPLLADLFQRARAGDAAQRVDLVLKDSRHIISAAAARIPGDEALSLTARDVTDERALARELAQTKDFLSSLIDANPDAVVATDLNGNIRVFNKTAELLYGRAAHEVLGQVHITELFPPGAVAEVITILRGPEQGGPGRLSPALNRSVLGKDEQSIPVLLSAAMMRIHGKDSAAVFILRDLRDRIEIETRLHRTEERLAESEKMALLAELAGATAHELNQPLTSVMGYAELMRRRVGLSDALNLKALNTIESEAQRMADIVKRIGRLTRYETKTYVGNTRIIDIAASSDDGNTE